MNPLIDTYPILAGSITAAVLKSKAPRDIDPTDIKSMEEVYKEYLEEFISFNEYTLEEKMGTLVPIKTEIGKEAKVLLDKLKDTNPELFL